MKIGSADQFTGANLDRSRLGVCHRKVHVIDPGDEKGNDGNHNQVDERRIVGNGSHFAFYSLNKMQVFKWLQRIFRVPFVFGQKTHVRLNETIDFGCRHFRRTSVFESDVIPPVIPSPIALCINCAHFDPGFYRNKILRLQMRVGWQILENAGYFNGHSLVYTHNFAYRIFVSVERFGAGCRNNSGSRPRIIGNSIHHFKRKDFFKIFGNPQYILIGNVSVLVTHQTFLEICQSIGFNFGDFTFNGKKQSPWSFGPVINGLSFFFNFQVYAVNIF